MMGLAKRASLKVGQEIAVVNNRSYSTDQSIYRIGYVIEKITPTGQITIKSKDGKKWRFDSDGWEYGMSSDWVGRRTACWLEPDVAKAKRIVREQLAVAKILEPLNEIHKLKVLRLGDSLESVIDRIEFIHSKLDQSRLLLKEFETK